MKELILVPAAFAWMWFFSHASEFTGLVGSTPLPVAIFSIQCALSGWTIFCACFMWLENRRNDFVLPDDTTP